MNSRMIDFCQGELFKSKIPVVFHITVYIKENQNIAFIPFFFNETKISRYTVQFIVYHDTPLKIFGCCFKALQPSNSWLCGQIEKNVIVFFDSLKPNVIYFTVFEDNANGKYAHVRGWDHWVFFAFY